ncbi:MAG: hypothetical protein JWN39_3713 [Ilumatobacteraceae bacterium]|nr:hypothetical protein [Ilumatobacteraceae bacterium]
MTDILDQAVRAAIASFADSAPEPVEPTLFAATAGAPPTNTVNPPARATVPFGPAMARTRPGPSRRRRTVAARVMAVVVLVAALVAGLTVLVHRHSNTTTAAPTGADLRWMLTDLPTGLSPQSVDGPQPVTGLESDPLARNGFMFATAAAPLGPMFAVYDAANGLSPGYDSSVTNYTELTLAGRRAALADGPGGLRLLYLEVGNDRWVEIDARSTSDAELTKIATALVASSDGTAVVDPDTLPAGVVQLPGDLTNMTNLTGGVTLSVYGGSAPGRLLWMYVSSKPTSIETWFALIGTTSQPVNVGGDAGTLIVGLRGTSENDVVMWRHDGLSFAVVGGNITSDELLAAASTAQPVSVATWSSFPSHAELLSKTPPSADTVTVGTSPPDTQPPIGETDPTSAPSATTAPSVTVATSAPIATAEPTVATDLSSSETRFQGALASGVAWTAHVTVVFDRIQFSNTVDGSADEGAATAGYGPMDADPIQINTVSTAGVDFVTTVATDAKAVSLRVTTKDGHRYIDALHASTSHPNDHLGVIAVDANTVTLAEVLDGSGTVLESIATS